jgi:hypothetical protein
MLPYLTPLQCFNQIMTGIYFLQAMALCVLLVKGFAFAALIIPLIVFTAVVHSNCNKLYRRPWTLMSAKEAAILDARDPVSCSPKEKLDNTICGATSVRHVSILYAVGTYQV